MIKCLAKLRIFSFSPTCLINSIPVMHKHSIRASILILQGTMMYELTGYGSGPGYFGIRQRLGGFYDLGEVFVSDSVALQRDSLRSYLVSIVSSWEVNHCFFMVIFVSCLHFNVAQKSDKWPENILHISPNCIFNTVNSILIHIFIVLPF